jgi:ubiquinone/menaquinone biosynthesis C-methylase UbiE
MRTFLEKRSSMTTRDVSSDWWDGRIPDSLFSEIYKIGDDSDEGFDWYLPGGVKKRTDRECDLILDALSPNTNADILDCPCGYGRHSLEMARRGYKMVGVDLNPTFLSEAKSIASQERLSSRFVEGDMRSLPLSSSSFDFAINMFFSFGFFDDTDNRKVLEEFFRVLKPSGKLLIHTDVNPRLLDSGAYQSLERKERRLRNGDRLNIEEHYDPHAQHLYGSWAITDRYENMKSANYKVRIYSDRELIDLALEVGFQNVTIQEVNKNISNNELAQEIIYIFYK